MQNPLDESTKAEIQELIKAVLATFTTQYLLAYKTHLIQKIKEDFNATPSNRELDTRPEPTEPLMSGWLTKRGNVRKNWKKRWVVVYPNYLVKYFEKEGGKEKGEMQLDGYKLNKDPGASVFERTMDLMKKLNASQEEMEKEKGDKWPDHCFELFHAKRRCWYIQAENDEDKEKWMEMFKTVCRKAPGRSKEDMVAYEAFNDAIWATRWELGRWGWWSFGGTEGEILSDLVCDQLEYAVMGNVYARITGGWRVRHMISEQVQKFLGTTVGAAVSAAWKAVKASIDELRPKVEDGLKSALTPFLEAEKNIKQKMTDTLLNIVTPTLQEVVTPALAPIMAVLLDPIHEGYQELYAMFQERIDEFVGNCAAGIEPFNVGKETRVMYRHCHSWWSMRAAYRKVNDMRDPLCLLGELVSSIYVWSVIWDIEDHMRRILEDAFYTFEKDLTDTLENSNEGKAAANDGDAAKQVIQKAAERTMQKFKHDVLLQEGDEFKSLLQQCVWSPFSRKVLPLVQEPVKPLDDLVPSPLKDLIDISALLEEFLKGLVFGAIDNVVDPAVKKCYAK